LSKDDDINMIEAKKTRPMIFMGRVEKCCSSALWLCLRLCFGKANWALTFLPLTALLEQFDTLETFEDRTLSTGSAGCFE